mgnify:FL=1
MKKLLNNEINSILNTYGEETLNKILELKHLFYVSDAYKTYNDKSDWDLIRKKAVQDFKNNYPTANEELIDLFWWTYSFSLWKNGTI